MRWPCPWGLLLLTACSPVLGGEGAAQDEAPAQVLPPAGTGDVATLVLTPETELRLGLRVEPLELRSLPRARTYGAEVALPPGRSIPLLAPVAGTLALPDGAQAPAAGWQVEQGQELFELIPLLSPERDVLTPSESVQNAKALSDLEVARARARGALACLRARLDVAQIALARAETLVEQEAGSLRARDEARAEVRMAQALHDAAREAVIGLEAISLEEGEPGEQSTLVLRAPLTGTLMALSAAPGRVVGMGEQLFVLAALDPLWIRVPVYVGDLDQIDTAQDALLVDLGGRATAEGRSARPVAAPPSANPRASSADLWYEVSGDGATGLRPGQRVGASLTLRGDEQVLTVPWSAVLVDVQGNEWVYVRVDEHTYARRRVEVERVSGDRAVLARGPPAATPVVVVAVAELYGTEFDPGH